MTDPQETTTVTSEPRTALDVQIAELQKEIETMQAAFRQTVEELQAANRSLFAHATGTAGETVPTEPEEPQGFRLDDARSACLHSLGLTE